jgi:hypothetical protein
MPIRKYGPLNFRHRLCDRSFGGFMNAAPTSNHNREDDRIGRVAANDKARLQSVHAFPHRVDEIP